MLFQYNLLDSGVYTAYLATWHYIIEVEKKKKICIDLEKRLILSMVLSELTIIRKMLFDYMQCRIQQFSIPIESASSLQKSASPKLNQLMKILLSLKRTDVCLVFVDRRTTAKILYHYIKVSFKTN